MGGGEDEEDKLDGEENIIEVLKEVKEERKLIKIMEENKIHLLDNMLRHIGFILNISEVKLLVNTVVDRGGILER